VDGRDGLITTIPRQGQRPHRMAWAWDGDAPTPISPFSEEPSTPAARFASNPPERPHASRSHLNSHARGRSARGTGPSS